MDPASERLRTAFVAAYRPYLHARLGELGLEAPDSLPGALVAGEGWLDRELVALLEASPERQARGPLEIFQEAVRFPTEALESADTPPVTRDRVAANALPGDLYDLAPASSSALGEEAWQAHLAWGAKKARALAVRSLTLICTNLLDRSRVESAAQAAGYEVVPWEDAGPVPTLALVDLAAPNWEKGVGELVGAGVRVIVFGPHVDVESLELARELGAEEALSRSSFYHRLPEILG